MPRPLLALFLCALLLSTPVVGARHLEAGLDCAGAGAYVARIDGRIKSQHALYNTTATQLNAAKTQRDALAKSLVDRRGVLDGLSDALVDGLRGGGGKLAKVVDATLPATDLQGATPESVQQVFFDEYLARYGMSESAARDAVDAREKEDDLEDLIDAADDARDAIRAVLDKRASAATLKRTLDGLGIQLRALADEAAHVRSVCGLGGGRPTVPASEVALGTPAGARDADLLAALFGVANAARLLRAHQETYVEDVLEPLAYFSDDDELDGARLRDIENALEDAQDALKDIAPHFDRALALSLGALDALDFALPTSDAVVKGVTPDDATSSERTSALRAAPVAESTMRTNHTFARSAIATARAGSAAHQVRFVAPGGVEWPREVLVVVAGGDPGTPLASLASNGTTRLLNGTYDVYAVDAAGRSLLRQNVSVIGNTTSVDIGGRVRASLAGSGPDTWRWGVVPAGSVLLPTTRTQILSNGSMLVGPGSYDVFIQRPGRMEVFIGNVTVAAGATRDVDAPPRCTALFDMLAIDIERNGFAWGGTLNASAVSARNGTLRWVERESDDLFLVADATALRSAGWTLTANGTGLRGLTLFVEGLVAAPASGANVSVADAPALLGRLDENKDGFVDEDDDAWGALRLWRDADADGVIAADEVVRASDRLSAIPVAFGPSGKDANGSLVRHANVTLEDGTSRPARAVHFAQVGVCGNGAPPARPTQPTVTTPVNTTTPAVTTTTPTATTRAATTTTPVKVTASTPTPSTRASTPASPSVTTSTTPPPSPVTTTPEHPDPIPGAGVALLLAALVALAVLMRRR